MNGSCVRLSWRDWLPVALGFGVAVVLALWLTPAVPAAAQGTIALDDFDDSGLETDALALITAGGSADFYNSGILGSGARCAGAAGALEDGELGISADNVLICEIEWMSASRRMVLKDNDDLDLSTYFGSGGDGADLTLYIQTAGGLAQSNSTPQEGSNYVRFSFGPSDDSVINGIGDGTRFIVALARDLPAPGTAGTPTLTVDSPTAITASWTAGTNADGYKVQWSETSGGFSETDQATTADASYTISGLDPDTTYYVRVISTRTGADDGTPSAEASATTDSLNPPGRVTGVSATADDYHGITVTWRPAADADGYVVQWDTDHAFGSPTEATISSGAAVTHAITRLQEDTAYYVRVYATRTDADDGAPSTPDTATTALQPPTQATGVSATAASDVSVDVLWTAALRASGYRVEWGTTSGAYPDRATATSNSHTITGLMASTTYYLRVVATRAGAGAGTPSDEADATTETAPTPAQVTGVTATAISDREIQATWTAATHATGYVVQWDTDGAFSDPDQSEAAGTGVIIERLTSETEYHVRVKRTRAGTTDGAYSTPASATTGDAQTRVWAQRFPGGPVAAQLGLSVFAGVLSGVRFKSMKSPRREAVITGSMSLGALILPAFGLANEFWVIGVALLVLLASIAAIFLARR